MDITLAILAAGIGSRFGGGVKQLEPVGPNGEIIIDYSIHDAIRAGFNKVVFILRPDIYDDFREVIGDRMEALFRRLGVKWAYAFQNLDELPAGRCRPWGTGEAVLACRDILDGPFAVINADDYYGRDAFVRAYEFLAAYRPEAPNRCGMVGFVMKNTLSDNGGVTRGICEVDGRGFLTKIVETRNIEKTPEGAAVRDENGLRPVDVESVVSMNLWMLTPSFVEALDPGFEAFKKNLKNPEKDEYLLPTIVDGLLQRGMVTVEVLSTEDRWFGVTYREDKQTVVDAFRELYARGVYEPELYSDMENMGR